MVVCGCIINLQTFGKEVALVMKKIIAVLIAVMIVLSAATMAFVAFAETTSAEATTLAADDDEGKTIDLSGYPEWLQELITRLVEVFTKLMLKLGLKISIISILL